MDDPELKDWRRAYRRLQEAGSDACPPDEALAALALGEVAAQERTALADHVASCRRCAAAYRDLLDLHREAQRAGAAASVVAAPRRRTAWALAAAAGLAAVSLAGWNAALLDDNRQLAADLADARTGAETRPADPRPADPADPAVQEALEQLTELTRRVEGQTEQIAQLEGEVTTLRAPRFNVPVVDLDPGTARGAGGEASQTVKVPAGATLVTLILNPSERPAPGSYGLEILAGDGRSVWSGTGLLPTSFDNFSLAVPRGLLPDGRYRFRLTTARGTALETYEVKIETQENR